MIGRIVKFVLIYAAAGAACKAGEYLWDNLLKDKATTLVNAVAKKSVKTES